VVASFAALAKSAVLADCDVDAADLHLVTGPVVERREPFTGGKKATVDPQRCTGCGRCETLCRFGAVFPDGPGNENVESTYRIDHIACEGCGVCARFCPEGAIVFEPVQPGEWFISHTRFGPMVHAKLGIAQSNSGKLVSLVRAQAKEVAQRAGRELILVDGAPGIGCPVIASLAGADLALAVTEPTVAGRHDLERVCELTRHFRLRTLLCVNRWDLNEDMAGRIETEAARMGVEAVGRVAYDPAVTAAQIAGLSVVEYDDGPAARDLRALWDRVSAALNGHERG
jgi:MinD superfamily P-loop ATPase